jgi:hypothetical protein
MTQVVGLLAVGLAGFAGRPDDPPSMKFGDCPAPVKKTLEAEARGFKIETVFQEKGEEETVYWAEARISGIPYAIGVLEDGTLSEMNRAVDDVELPLDKCPPTVQVVMRREAFSEKITEVGKDVKYGVVVYATVVQHRGKAYQIVVAEDGTLVEKVLVVDDDEIELEKCPAAVRAALEKHSEGGTIGEITRTTGIAHPTFEAEVKIKEKVYLIELADSGALISKSLEAAQE